VTQHGIKADKFRFFGCKGKSYSQKEGYAKTPGYNLTNAPRRAKEENAHG